MISTGAGRSARAIPRQTQRASPAMVRWPHCGATKWVPGPWSL